MPTAQTQEPAAKKVPLNRENTRSVGLPLVLYQWLDEYRQRHSTEYDEKSLSWAARRAISHFKKLVEDGEVT